MTYSVAIRTLGTSLDTLRRELESLHYQTIPPDKIIVYIAEGYERPEFTIGSEEYIWVKKGMIAQRALKYDEIDSECILMLDDDVELAPDSMERLFAQMKESGADCIAVDTFKNHEMSFKSKLKAAVGNWVFPRFNQKWAFKIHLHDSFSYINKPKKDYYPSMSAAGPASLWKKEAYQRIHFEDEIWLDKLGFPYGEDGLFYYKLYLNGGKLVVSFNNGFVNLDGKASSSIFQKSSNKLYIRAFSNYVRWHRVHYLTNKGFKQIQANTAFNFKLIWMMGLHLMLCCVSFSNDPIKNFVKGNKDARSFIMSSDYRKLPPFKF